MRTTSARSHPAIPERSPLHAEVTQAHKNVASQLQTCIQHGFFSSGSSDRIDLQNAIRQDVSAGMAQKAFIDGLESLPHESASLKLVQSQVKSRDGRRKLAESLIQLYAKQGQKTAKSISHANKQEDLSSEAEFLNRMPDVTPLANQMKLHHEVVALASMIHALNHASSKLFAERLTEMLLEA